MGIGVEVSMPRETVKNSDLTVCRCRAAESLRELSPPDDHPPLATDPTSILLVLWSKSYAQDRILAVNLEGSVPMRVGMPLSLRIPPTRVVAVPR